MTEPEFLTPEWHQHILDTLHDETGVRVHHDRMEFPGGHTFPVLGPTVYSSNKHDYSVHAVVASEHIYPRRFFIDKYIKNNKHEHSLSFFHVFGEPLDNNVRYSTRYSNPNLLHPEQFGLEVQNRLRTVHDPETSENERQKFMKTNKVQVQRHLNRNKKIFFGSQDEPTNKWKTTLYDPHTGEVQHVNDDEIGSY
jgi:hypothetical protein